MKYALPFGTFLAIGAAASATAGPALLSWYFRLW
jgi:prepilin signal peptidase PulO-like enzyme (type II secretory pathway)